MYVALQLARKPRTHPEKTPPMSTKAMLMSILHQNSGEPSSSPTEGPIAWGAAFAGKGEEWDGGRAGVRSMGVKGQGVMLSYFKWAVGGPERVIF